jgi:hypothetical protein
MMSLQQKPCGQVELRESQGLPTWRANHRSPGQLVRDVEPSSEADSWFTHDVHVLGPPRLEKSQAHADLQGLKIGYRLGGESGMFEVLLGLSGPHAHMSNIREWSVEVEMSYNGQRRARASCVVHPEVFVSEKIFGIWRRFRTEAEHDLQLIMDNFVNFGIREARAAPAAPGPPQIVYLSPPNPESRHEQLQF